MALMGRDAAQKSSTTVGARVSGCRALRGSSPWRENMKSSDRDRGELEDALTGLGRAAAALRLSSAKLLSRRARGNWTAPLGAWLTAPRAIDGMLAALDDESIAVRVELIQALGNVCARYKLDDPRVCASMLRVAEAGPDRVRIEVARSVGYFGGDAAWDAVLAALSAKPARAARDAVGLAVARFGESIPPERRGAIADQLLSAATREKEPNALRRLLGGLALVAGPEHVLALEALRSPRLTAVCAALLEDVIGDAGRRGK
jgi:hypothetical protein